jgi:replication factor C subunit 3/5
MATLAHIFGHGVEKLKMETKTFVTPSNRKIDLNIVSSNYHLELTPRYYILLKQVMLVCMIES